MGPTRGDIQFSMELSVEVGVPTYLVNNAGVGWSPKDMSEGWQDYYETILDVNIKAGLYLIR